MVKSCFFVILDGEIAGHFYGFIHFIHGISSVLITGISGHNCISWEEKQNIQLWPEKLSQSGFDQWRVEEKRDMNQYNQP